MVEQKNSEKKTGEREDGPSIVTAEDFSESRDKIQADLFGNKLPNDEGFIVDKRQNLEKVERDSDKKAGEKTQKTKRQIAIEVTVAILIYLFLMALIFRLPIEKILTIQVIAGTILSILFMLFLHRQYKKSWFALSLILFFIASLIAYQVVWIDQEPPRDSIITLFSSSGADSITWLNYASCDYSCWNNLLHSKCSNVFHNNLSKNGDLSEELLDGPIKNYSALKINCTPRKNLFTEGDYMFCRFNSSVILPYEIMAVNCLMNRTDGNVTYPVHMSFITRLIPWFCINYVGLSCTDSDWKEINEVNGSYPIKIQTSGLQDIALALDWQYSYVEAIGNNSPGGVGKAWEYKKGIVYKPNTPIDISSGEEVLEYSKKSRERGYQFILALFALFSVSTAVYNLKKLWENKKDEK